MPEEDHIRVIRSGVLIFSVLFLVLFASQIYIQHRRNVYINEMFPGNQTQLSSYLYEFKPSCKESCLKYKTTNDSKHLEKYCRDTMIYDINHNEKMGLAIRKGNLIWENSVHCFNVVNCSIGEEDNKIVEKCVDILCKKYESKQKVRNILQPEPLYDTENLSKALNFSKSYFIDEKRGEFIGNENGSRGLWRENWWIDVKESLKKYC